MDRVEVHQRFFRQSIKKNAASIILAHNHPSGICQPSLADEPITRKNFYSLSIHGCQKCLITLW
ncbi:JAB domain-containing protein [Enterobacter hormaechei]